MSKERLFGSMLSGLPLQPSYALQLGRRWRSKKEQQPPGPVLNTYSSLKREEYSVIGPDRWKYFKCPVIPYAQQNYMDLDIGLHNDYMDCRTQMENVRRNTDVKQDSLDKTESSSKTRGTIKSKSTHTTGFKSYYVDSHEGLLEVEARLHTSVLRQQVSSENKFSIIKDLIRPAEKKEIGLLRLYKALRQIEPEVKKSKKEDTPTPPVTPKVEEPPEGEEDIEIAVIHLQKLLRGRSIQYEMFNGKENHLELIRELRSVHALQGEEQEQQRVDKELTMTMKTQRNKHQREVCRQEASQARVVGTELQQLFDTLSKELIRLQEERRIHAFMLLAERDRLTREAEESGRRQAEERRRKEEDEILRQITQVHQETVDLYFEDIILKTLEETADEQAKEEIHRITEEVNNLAYAMEEGRNDLQSEEIVSELVYNFLIPEVEKICIRQRVHQQQHRHLQAARRIIQGSPETTGIRPSSFLVSQLACPSERASGQVLSPIIGKEPTKKE